MKEGSPAALLKVCAVPGQSLGANVVIVQVGEDVVDDAALLLGPLNHLVLFSFVQAREKTLNGSLRGAPVYLNVSHLPHALSQTLVDRLEMMRLR